MTRALRSPFVIGGLVVALVVVLIWLFAFFIPQGNKINTLNTQETLLLAKQAALEAQVAALQKTSEATPQLLALEAAFAVAVPPTPDTYTYLTTMVATTAKAGVKLSTISTGSPGSPTDGVSSISVTLSTSGTYDQTLTFIHLLNTLPRLTIINSLALQGGGPGTNRESQLTESFALTIFTSNGANP
jgi:Tfp pilus assembly protein PilO